MTLSAEQMLPKIISNVWLASESLILDQAHACRTHFDELDNNKSVAQAVIKYK